MRVLVVIDSLSEPGGAEFVASQWTSYMAQEGDRVTVYLAHPREDDFAPDGVSLVRAHKDNFVGQTRDLARYLKDHPVDIVLSLMPYCNLMSVAAVRSLGASRPKVAISERNLAHGLQVVFGSSHAMKIWLGRRIYRYADLFVAISHPVGAEAIALYKLPWDRVTVVPNPAIAKMAGRVARPEGSVDPGHLDIAVPARLHPQKRPLIAVEVAAILSSAFTRGVTVHFFGVGSLHEAIVSQAREANVDVVMHGWVDDWFNQCPAGAVVLLPSIVEGFGNVLVEAAAAGFRSVVSSRCMGSADAVVPGITGELVAGDSTDEYAAGVLATAHQAVHDAEPWLRRFSFENSGRIIRDAMVRTVNRAGGIEP